MNVRDNYQRIMSVEEAMEALHSDGFVELSSVGETNTASEDVLFMDLKENKEAKESENKEEFVVDDIEVPTEIINYDEETEKNTVNEEDTSKCFTLEEDSPENLNQEVHLEKSMNELNNELSGNEREENDLEISSSNEIPGSEILTTHPISHKVTEEKNRSMNSSEKQNIKEINKKDNESAKTDFNDSKVIKESTTDVSPVQVSQILKNTDNLIEQIRENLDQSKEENVKETKKTPGKRNDKKLIIVMSTLESNNSEVEKRLDEVEGTEETLKQEDMQSPKLHLVKKGGVFTIDNKKTPSFPIRENWEVLKPGNSNKRKTSQDTVNLNFKLDDCNMCKKCNVSIYLNLLMII